MSTNITVERGDIVIAVDDIPLGTDPDNRHKRLLEAIEKIGEVLVKAIAEDNKKPVPSPLVIPGGPTPPWNLGDIPPSNPYQPGIYGPNIICEDKS